MLDAESRQFGWTTAGPVAAAYGRSFKNGSVAVCVGPTGGGKTTESIRRTIRVAQLQHPSPIDGVRKGRTVVLAPTYRKLWDQVIPSYKDELSWSDKGWTGGKGEPADHIYDFEWRMDDGRVEKVHVEVLFRAPGEGDLEDFFRGLKATAFWIPEMDTHETVDLLSLASNRTHRYPEMRDRPDPDRRPDLADAYGGVYGDANAPIIGSWFHDRFFLETKASDLLFLQPPGYDPDSVDGFHPQAENKHNLRRADRQFYRTKAANHEHHDVVRLLENKPGYSRQGKPVHEHFNAITMKAIDGLEPDPNLPVVVGLDAGSNTLSHSAVFFQRTFGGQVRALAEVPYEGQSDIVEVSLAIKRLRETRFAACRDVEIVADPAVMGQSAAKRGVTWCQMIQVETGLPTRPAPSQDPGVRRGALDQVLKKQAGPGTPAFMVDAIHCPSLIKALAGGYHFKRTKNAYSEIPVKDKHSHIADACHYGVLGLNGVGSIPAHNPHDWEEGHSGDLGALLPG